MADFVGWMQCPGSGRWKKICTGPTAEDTLRDLQQVARLSGFSWPLRVLPAGEEPVGLAQKAYQAVRELRPW